MARATGSNIENPRQPFTGMLMLDGFTIACMHRDDIMHASHRALRPRALCRTGDCMLTFISFQVREVVKKGDTDGDGQLNFDEFVKAIKADEKARSEPLTSGTILETIFLVLVTSLFEMGTSFSLPATGAPLAALCHLCLCH